MANSKFRLLRLPAVIEATGLGRSAIYALEARGEFPRRRKLTPRASAWRSDEVAAWIDSRPVASVQLPAA
jgi:prophage regulatory protein